MLSIVLHSFVHIAGQLHAYSIAKAPKKLLIGQHSGRLANVYLLRNQPLNEQILRWCDHWLKGIDTGIMDELEVAIFDDATQEWRYENEYSSARTEWTDRLRLTSSARSCQPAVT